MGVTIIGVETAVVPTMDVVRMGVLIGFATKLGSRSGGVSTRKISKLM